MLSGGLRFLIIEYSGKTVPTIGLPGVDSADGGNPVAGDQSYLTAGRFLQRRHQLLITGRHYSAEDIADNPVTNNDRRSCFNSDDGGVINILSFQLKEMQYRGILFQHGSGIDALSHRLIESRMGIQVPSQLKSGKKTDLDIAQPVGDKQKIQLILSGKLIKFPLQLAEDLQAQGGLDGIAERNSHDRPFHPAHLMVVT